MVGPDEFTFPSILKACSKYKAAREGKQIHAHVVKLQNEFGSKEFVENALAYTHGSCGQVNLTHKLFDKMSKRSAIFSGYVRCGY